MRGLYWWIALPLNLVIFSSVSVWVESWGLSAVVASICYLIIGMVICVPLNVMIRTKLGRGVRLTVRGWRLFWWKQWEDLDGYATKIWYRSGGVVFTHTRWDGSDYHPDYPDVDEMIEKALS